jgi:chromosome segregation ATPase
MSDQNAAFQPIIEELQRFTEGLRNLHADVTLMRNDVTVLGTEIPDRLQRLQTLVEEGLSRVRAEASTDLARTRAEIMDRIDRLQGTIELMRDDARVNWATADNAMSRLRNTREDLEGLQAQISAMERRYQTLAALVEELRRQQPPA